MRLVHALGAAVAATTLVASVAQATLTMSLAPVPIDPAAGNQIGGGQTVRTFQLKVIQSGEKFDVANLQVTLASGGGLSGYFYASPNHTVDPGLQATTSNISPLRNYANTDVNFYDTYVTTPVAGANPTQATITDHLRTAGSADWPVGPGSTTPVHPLPGVANNQAGQNQTLNIVWGDYQGGAASNTTGTAGDALSTYTVAQFTVVGNAGAYIKGYNGGSGSANVAQNFGPDNYSAGVLPSGVMYLPMSGDADLDGAVGINDLNIVKANAGTATSAGDVDGDGAVGINDLNIVKANAGLGMPANVPPPGASLGSLVPEPSSLMLGLVAPVLAMRRRSRRA